MVKVGILHRFNTESVPFCDHRNFDSVRQRIKWGRKKVLWFHSSMNFKRGWMKIQIAIQIWSPHDVDIPLIMVHIISNIVVCVSKLRLPWTWFVSGLPEKDLKCENRSDHWTVSSDENRSELQSCAAYWTLYYDQSAVNLWVEWPVWRPVFWERICRLGG